MGQCQSQPHQRSRAFAARSSVKDGGDIDVTDQLRNAERKKRSKKKKKSKQKRGRLKGLSILTAAKAAKSSNDEQLPSPSEETVTTQPATPASEASPVSGTAPPARAATERSPLSVFKSSRRRRSRDVGSVSDESNSIAASSQISSSSALEALKEEDDESRSASSVGSPGSLRSTNIKLGGQSFALVDFNQLVELQHHAERTPVTKNTVSDYDSLVAPSDEESMSTYSRHSSLGGSVLSEDEQSLEPNLRRSALTKSKRNSGSGRSRRRPESSILSSYNGKPVDITAAITSSERAIGTQTSVKILNQKVIQPSSIIHRQAPVRRTSASSGNPDSVAAAADLPTESVDMHTLSDFNKLKLQVQISKKAEKQKRKKERIQERLEDIRGYKSLWNDFEQIEQQVKESDTESLGGHDTCSLSRRSLERSNSMDLKDSQSWYFDFSLLREQNKMPPAKSSTQGESSFHGIGSIAAIVDDDNRSHSNLSLLSAASMEAQKRLFAEKRKQRRSRHKKGKKNSKKSKRKEYAKTDDDGSVSSSNTASSRLSSSSAFKGQTEEGDYGPPRSFSGISSSILNHDSDEDTPPRANSCRLDSDDGNDSQASGRRAEREPVPEGDYRVVRRRRGRVYQGHDWDDNSSISTYENLGDQITRDLQEYRASRSVPAKETPVTLEIRKLADKAPTEKYGFDPSAPLSLQLDVLSARLESLNKSPNGVEDGAYRWQSYTNPLGLEPSHDTSNIAEGVQRSLDAALSKVEDVGTEQSSDAGNAKPEGDADYAASTGSRYNSHDNAQGNDSDLSASDNDSGPGMPLARSQTDAGISKENIEGAEDRQLQLPEEPLIETVKAVETTEPDAPSGAEVADKPAYGVPLGSYSAGLAVMSSAEFLHMAAMPSVSSSNDCAVKTNDSNTADTIDRDDVNSCDRGDAGDDTDEDGEVVDDFAERLRAAKLRYREKLKKQSTGETASQPTKAPKFDPGLSTMSADHFLCLSDRYSTMDSLPLDVIDRESASQSEVPARVEQRSSESADTVLAGSSTTGDRMSALADDEAALRALAEVENERSVASLESSRSSSYRVLHTGEVVSTDSADHPDLFSRDSKNDPGSSFGIISIAAVDVVGSSASTSAAHNCAGSDLSHSSSTTAAATSLASKEPESAASMLPRDTVREDARSPIQSTDPVSDGERCAATVAPTEPDDFPHEEKKTDDSPLTNDTSMAGTKDMASSVTSQIEDILNRYRSASADFQTHLDG